VSLSGITKPDALVKAFAPGIQTGEGPLIINNMHLNQPCNQKYRQYGPASCRMIEIAVDLPSYPIGRTSLQTGALREEKAAPDSDARCSAKDE
jgi:hypothetical protein